jgi:hypothetical protein
LKTVVYAIAVEDPRNHLAVISRAAKTSLSTSFQ